MIMNQPCSTLIGITQIAWRFSVYFPYFLDSTTIFNGFGCLGSNRRYHSMVIGWQQRFMAGASPPLHCLIPLLQHLYSGEQDRPWRREN